MGQYYSVTVPITRFFGERGLGGAKHLTTEDMKVFIEDKTHKEHKVSNTLRGLLCFLGSLWPFSNQRRIPNEKNFDA